MKKNDITKKWLKRIKKAEKKLKEKHRKYAKKAEEHYYNDGDKKIELPLYWSSVQVQRSALYSQPPAPEIRGRNNDVTNPLSKQISKVLEEAISYQIDQSDFHSDAKRAVLDFIVTDLGVARLRMDTKTQPITSNVTGETLMNDDGSPYEVVASQDVYIDHWPWKRFIYDIGKDWAECDWICYVHFMDSAEIKKKYDYNPNDNKTVQDDEDHEHTVYEVWSKANKTVYEFIEGKDSPLRERKDPLNLKGFYDCPKPLIANMRSDKYLPQSDFKQIATQLDNINALEKRIARLTSTIKYRGFRASEVAGLDKVATAADGQFMPVDGLGQLMEKGWQNLIAALPIVEQAQAIQILEGQKKEAKEQIYEITGLSDIIRGNTKATETATAQQIKGQWASVRLQDKQSTINGWLRSIMRLYAEFIAEHFTPQQLALMTGEQLDEQAIETMRSDVLRCYAIDVETDSTIQADESQDRADRMEMVNTLLTLLQTIIPAVQQNMMPMDMGKTLLLTAVRGFKHARPLEDMVNGLGDNMQQLQQLQQQLQQQGQQTQQMDAQYEQQMAQLQQQNQQLQNELGKFNTQEEQRKNMDVQSEVQKEAAETKKKQAETAKIYNEISQSIIQPSPSQVGMQSNLV